MTQINLVSATFIIFLIQYTTFCHKFYKIHIEEVGIKSRIINTQKKATDDHSLIFTLSLVP